MKKKTMFIILCLLFLLLFFCVLIFLHYNNTNHREGISDSKNKKIAFCFLIYDSINQEELWHQFFQNVDTSKYTIYIHYKENKPLTYFEPYKLKNCIETSWGNISLVKAQNLLLEEGLKDLENSHFVFLSNSCVPFKSFDYIYDTLDAEYSYFDVVPNQRLCFPQCDSVLKFIDKKNVQKASQWSILNRKHAKVLIGNQDYLTWFDQPGIIPDEHCYISFLYHTNLQNEIKETANSDVSMDATTFVSWNSSGVNQFETISEEKLQEFINSKSLFGRKFEKKCNLDYLKPFIES